MSPIFGVSPVGDVQNDSVCADTVAKHVGTRTAQSDSVQILITVCTRMLRESPHNVAVRLRRAALYLWAGVDDRALSDYNLVLDDEPTCEEALLFRADIYRRKRSYRLARADYESIIQMHPNNMKACIGLVITNDADGRPQEAMNQINLIIEAWPEEGLPYLVRGEMYMRRGIYPQALLDFDESIRLDPANPDAYISRGLYYRYRHKTSLARDDFRRAVEMGADADYVYGLLRGLR